MEVTNLNIDGKKYIRLYVSPNICHQNGDASERTFWQHANGCNGNIFIGENALCYCEKCKTRSHIRNWQIKCDNLTPPDEEHNPGKIDNRASITNCTAMAGEMVKEGGIAWLKSFLSGLSDYTSDNDANLVMRPYTQHLDEERCENQHEDADAIEASNEDFQGQSEPANLPDSPATESETSTTGDEIDNKTEPDKTNVEPDNNTDFDTFSFDESTFFERFSQKNN